MLSSVKLIKILILKNQLPRYPGNGLILVRVRLLLLLQGENKVNQPELGWSWVRLEFDNSRKLKLIISVRQVT